MKKQIVVIGAGPAGLTFAYELLKKTNDFNVTILEQSDNIGGISQTVCYKGNRMDLGGHRFFSKDERIINTWLELLPLQDMPSKDNIILDNHNYKKDGNINPEKDDLVMLLRNRISRIFYGNNFYDYPVKLKFQTLKNMGFITTLKVGFSYLYSCLVKQEENSLENFYINRFGKKLYQMFFEDYTLKLWGRHPKEISASWGRQRVKGLSVFGIFKDIFKKIFKIKNAQIETSLIEEFMYPKFGPGQLWEKMAYEIEAMGGKIIKNAKVVKINKTDNKISNLGYKLNDEIIRIDCDFLVSSMPIKDLVQAFEFDVNENVKNIAQNLPYRDFLTVGVLLNDLKIKNSTKIKTINNAIPDCWLYIQDSNVKLGRIQIFNNWSPYLVKNFTQNIWLGLEYFCQENDEFWSLDDEKIKILAKNELVKLGLINKEDEILDYCVKRVQKAYPAYFDSYNKIDNVIAFLNTFENLYCVGRNGQHRYNNMDHSMLTSIKAVEHLLNNSISKDEIWNVNTEQEYHETKNAQ